MRRPGGGWTCARRRGSTGRGRRRRASASGSSRTRCPHGSRWGGPPGCCRASRRCARRRFDPGAVDPRIAAFYERTSDFRLQLWSQWSPLHRPFGRMIDRVFARRLGQLRLPLAPLDTSRGVAQELLSLHGSDGATATAWLRRRLPEGEASIFLEPSAQTDGSFELVSPPGAFGEPGFYFVVRDGDRAWSRTVAAMTEHLHVYLEGSDATRRPCAAAVGPAVPAVALRDAARSRTLSSAGRMTATSPGGTSPGACSSSQATSAALSPSVWAVAAATTMPVVALLVEQLAQRVADRAAGGDARRRRRRRRPRRAARSPPGARTRGRRRAGSAPRATAPSAPARGRRRRASRPRCGRSAARRRARETDSWLPTYGKRIRRVRRRRVARAGGGRRAARPQRPTASPVSRSSASIIAASTPLRAVGDDADVDAGQRAQQPVGQRLGEAPQAAARRRRARSARTSSAARAATRAATSATSSPSSTMHLGAEQRRRAGGTPRSARARPPTARAPSTISTSSSAPRRCADRHARRTIRCEDGCGVTSASSRSPTACGAARVHQAVLARRDDVDLQALGLDVLGHLAQRDLAQRLEVLDAEEPVQRGRHARGAGRPCRPAGARSARAA